MHHRYLLAVLLILCACSGTNDLPKSVDPASVSPLSGRERALLLAAEAAARQNNNDAAERDYLSAVSASSGQVEAHVGLAQLYLRMKQTNKAIAILEKATTLQPQNPGANYLLGKLYLADSKPEAARSAFAAGRLFAPQDVDLVNGEAIANDMLGNHAAAQALYLPALARGKGQSLTPLRTNLAMSYLLSGDAKRALPLLQQEAKQPGASAVSHHNLALAYSLLGQPAQARKVLGTTTDDESYATTVARLKSYITDGTPGKTPPPLTP